MSSSSQEGCGAGGGFSFFLLLSLPLLHVGFILALILTRTAAIQTTLATSLCGQAPLSSLQVFSVVVRFRPALDGSVFLVNLRLSCSRLLPRRLLPGLCSESPVCLSARRSMTSCMVTAKITKSGERTRHCLFPGSSRASPEELAVFFGRLLAGVCEGNGWYLKG